MTNERSFASLLESAVKEPGLISSAYSQFHNYSLGNMILAWSQCKEREIPLGPIATFPRWKDLGRFVRKGEKALALCMPVTVKKQAETATDEPEVFTRFVYKNNWFVLAQTDGVDVPVVAPPSWDKSRALAALDVTEIPFDCANGNVMGYAKGRSVTVSPVNPHPFKPLFHECAHVLLGHTVEHEHADNDLTPRSLREVEAESVALLVCDALGLDGAEYSRGYIQSWIGAGESIPEKSAQKIMKVADSILKAGRPAETEQN